MGKKQTLLFGSAATDRIVFEHFMAFFRKAGASSDDIAKIGGDYLEYLDFREKAPRGTTLQQLSKLHKDNEWIQILLTLPTRQVRPRRKPKKEEQLVN